MEPEIIFIDGGVWPPQGMLRCARGDAVVLVTCGMQLRPQPTVELYAEDPRPFRRVELGLGIERRLLWLVPVTALERELAKRNGSEELTQRLAAKKHGFVHRDRLPVV